jgi:hypothetical protein
VVVVGVEPLGQVEGDDGTPADLTASSQGEVPLEVDRSVAGGVAGRDGTDQNGGVQLLPA